MHLKSLGHKVGLHFYVSHIVQNDKEGLVKEFEKQKSLFEDGFGFGFDVFSFHRPPKWVLEIRDDIFCGAFMTALADEKKIPEAIEFANHAAALSVTRFGVVESIPSIKEVKEFILKGVNKKNKKN